MSSDYFTKWTENNEEITSQDNIEFDSQSNTETDLHKNEVNSKNHSTKISLKLKPSFSAVTRSLWLILVPVILNLLNLYIYKNVLKRVYVPNAPIFTLKLGIISAPPGLEYILKDFPTPLLKYTSNIGHTGIISELNLLSILILLCTTVVSSFLTSGYLGCLEKTGRKKVRVRDFFKLGNKFWFKFFVLDLISLIPTLFVFINTYLLFTAFILVFLYYVKYSIVVDKSPLSTSFKNGINVFFNNIITTIKISICYGLIMSPFTIVVFGLSKFNIPGIIISIIITCYLGMTINKSVLEVYRTLRKSM
ncbi:hypothetical protein OW763_10840 [Clostridium aestuarii]|uniref:DUF624 domain-containing protein n=1 Tax=Clostridium aestuarii TaxID=338193 RepID=A0ABT4D2H5_9CLOT|nr:hypothetical protein [Clostridium aestuarii]MCY6484837.1 hypothetical protein [Clostridium aestuarii]